MNAPRESTERIHELLELYRRTHYDVTLPDGNAATLRIGVPPPQTVAAWIGTDAFAAYLTACNPHSLPFPDASNARRMARLRERLQRESARWLEGEGSIPVEPWCEPSLLVAGIALRRIDRIVCDFGQNASVVVRPAMPVRVRLHRDDWKAALPAADDLEWADVASRRSALRD